MSYYNYKYVRDILPEWITKEQGEDYEGGCDYDGDQWCAASDYIYYLIEKIKELNPEFDFTKRV